MAESEAAGQIMSMTYNPMQVEESELTVSAETVEDDSADAQAPQSGQPHGRKHARNPSHGLKSM